MSEALLTETHDILKQARYFFNQISQLPPPPPVLAPSQLWQNNLNTMHHKLILGAASPEEFIEATTSQDYFTLPCLSDDYNFDVVRKAGLKFFEKPGYELDLLSSEICESEFASSKAVFAHHGRRLSISFLWHLSAALRIREHVGSRLKNILEIGGGYGGLARICKLLNPQTTYYMVDIPECLIFAYVFLKKNFPDANIHFVTDGNIPSSGDFVLVPACFVNRFQPETIDLVFNSQSFSEMTAGAFNYFIEFIQSYLNPRFFYNINRFLEHVDGFVIEGRLDHACGADICFHTAALDAHWNVLYWALTPEDDSVAWDQRLPRILEILVERIPKEKRDQAAYDQRVQVWLQEVAHCLRVDSRLHYLMWNINRMSPSEKSLHLYIEILNAQKCLERDYYIRLYQALCGEKKILCKVAPDGRPFLSLHQ